MTGRVYVMRLYLRNILGWFFSSLFVALALTWLASNNSASIANYKIIGLSWSSWSWLQQYLFILTLTAGGITLASIVTLTRPNPMFLLLNVVFGSLVIYGIIVFVPILNVSIPNFHAPTISSGDFASLWLEVIGPALAVIDVIFYFVSTPYESSYRIQIRRGM